MNLNLLSVLLLEQTVGMMIALGVGAIIALYFLFYFIPVGMWFSALLSGVRISLLQLVLMRWRKVPPGVIVKAMINSTKAGLGISRDDLETHFLAGGNVINVVNALISADKANISLDFKSATAIDLAWSDCCQSCSGC